MFQQPFVAAHDFDHRFAHRQVIRGEHLQHLPALVHQVGIGAVADDQLHLTMADMAMSPDSTSKNGVLNQAKLGS